MFLQAHRPSIRVSLAFSCLAWALLLSACSGSSSTPDASAASSSEPNEASLAAAADGDLEDFALAFGEAFFNGDLEVLKPYVTEQASLVFDAALAGGLELSATDLRVASIDEETDGASLVHYAGEFCASAPSSATVSGEGVSTTDGQTITESRQTTSGDIETSCYTMTGEETTIEQASIVFTRGSDGRWYMK